MSVTPKIFQRWANKLSEIATDRTGKAHHVWVVPAPYCAMRHINDGRYLPGDGALESARLLKEVQKNVEFHQTRFSDSRIKFGSHGLFAVRAIKNLEFNDELYLDYGSAHDFARR